MAGRRGGQRDQEKCGQCNKIVSEKDSGVLCELCENWHHASCEGISAEVYLVLSNTAEVHWFCKKCNTHAIKMLKSVSKLHDRVNRTEERQTEIETELKKVKDSFQEINISVPLVGKLENRIAKTEDNMKRMQYETEIEIKKSYSRR